MPEPLPDLFNFKLQQVDPNEEYIRDQLEINLDGWTRFRHLIKGGTYSEHLCSDEIISDELKQSFIELGKANYEIILSLGYLKMERNYIKEYEFNLNLFVRKSIKEFYFHAGCLLDSFGRLIYIINHPKAASERGKQHFKRHIVDWGKAQQWEFPNFKDYSIFFDDNIIKEILNIRNNLTHNWHSIIILKEEDNSIVPYLPVAIRTTRNYLWHYEEQAEFENDYQIQKRVYQFIEDDFCHLEDFQNKLYHQLVNDLNVFEKNNHVQIK